MAVISSSYKAAKCSKLKTKGKKKRNLSLRYLKERDKNPSFRATTQIPAGKFIPTAEPNGERWEKKKNISAAEELLAEQS